MWACSICGTNAVGSKCDMCFARNPNLRPGAETTLSGGLAKNTFLNGDHQPLDPPIGHLAAMLQQSKLRSACPSPPAVEGLSTKSGATEDNDEPARSLGECTGPVYATGMEATAIALTRGAEVDHSDNAPVKEIFRPPTYVELTQHAPFRASHPAGGLHDPPAALCGVYDDSVVAGGGGSPLPSEINGEYNSLNTVVGTHCRKAPPLYNPKAPEYSHLVSPRPAPKKIGTSATDDDDDDDDTVGYIDADNIHSSGRGLRLPGDTKCEGPVYAEIPEGDGETSPADEKRGPSGVSEARARLELLARIEPPSATGQTLSVGTRRDRAAEAAALFGIEIRPAEDDWGPGVPRAWFTEHTEESVID